MSQYRWINGKTYYDSDSEINKERSLKLYIPELAYSLARTLLYKMGHRFDEEGFRDKITILQKELEDKLMSSLSVYYEDSPISPIPKQELIDLISIRESSSILGKFKKDNNAY